MKTVFLITDFHRSYFLQKTFYNCRKILDIAFNKWY